MFLGGSFCPDVCVGVCVDWLRFIVWYKSALSHLLISIPLKFLKAKDVQDPNFQGRITEAHKQMENVFIIWRHC